MILAVLNHGFRGFLDCFVSFIDVISGSWDFHVRMVKIRRFYLSLKSYFSQLHNENIETNPGGAQTSNLGN